MQLSLKPISTVRLDLVGNVHVNVKQKLTERNICEFERAANDRSPKTKTWSIRKNVATACCGKGVGVAIIARHEFTAKLARVLKLPRFDICLNYSITISRSSETYS